MGTSNGLIHDQDPATEAPTTVVFSRGKMGMCFTLGQSHIQINSPLDTNDNSLWSLTVPGGLMGANDSLRITTLWSHTNSANSKNMKTLFGGTVFQSFTAGATNCTQIQCTIRNRNAKNSQVTHQFAAGAIYGSAGTGVTTAAVDTTIDQVLSIVANKVSGAESLALECVIVELIRGTA